MLFPTSGIHSRHPRHAEEDVVRPAGSRKSARLWRRADKDTGPFRTNGVEDLFRPAPTILSSENPYPVLEPNTLNQASAQILAAW